MSRLRVLRLLGHIWGPCKNRLIWLYRDNDLGIEEKSNYCRAFPCSRASDPGFLVKGLGMFGKLGLRLLQSRFDTKLTLYRSELRENLKGLLPDLCK